MTRVVLCKTEEVHQDAVLCKRIPGAGEIAVARVGAADYVAFDPRCPHARGPLAEGKLHGCVIVCPWHFFRFDLRTGKSPGINSILELRRYPVVVEGGEILVEIG